MSKRKYKGRHKTETDTILNKAIGNKIKEARLNYIVLDKKKLCTQTKLANALYPPKTFQQIQKYEKGKNGVSTIILIHVPETSTTTSHTIKRNKLCTQSELAKSIGVTFQQIQKYERGQNGTSIIRLLQISNFFNLPLTYFTNGVTKLIGQVKPPINNSSTIAPSLVANKEELNMSV